MYATFYGFAMMPFGVTPDTRFFFPSGRHTEALATLIYAVTERKGFALLTGEIGAGKTTVARALLSNLDPNTRVALILNSHLTSKQLLECICQEFNLPTQNRDRIELHGEINEYLVRQLAEDRNVLLLIDEAQNLGPRTLEEVRMISNLETETEKLIQIVLMGQPELKRVIDSQDLEQLRQRITVRFHLTGLSYREILEYIAHRMRVAGNERGAKFTPGAFREIARFSRGIPRLINIACDHALLTGFVRQTKRITGDIVREVAAELSGEAPPAAAPKAEDGGRLSRTIRAAREMFWRPFRIRERA